MLAGAGNTQQSKYPQKNPTSLPLYLEKSPLFCGKTGEWEQTAAASGVARVYFTLAVGEDVFVSQVTKVS